MNEPGAPDPAFVRARTALLDVLDALGEHRRAVVLVGAQAVYLNVGEAREALSSFTTDADIAVNPELLASEPAVEAVLEGAGFERHTEPGLWFSAGGVEVDLLVPASLAGSGRRAASLGPGHDRQSAMRVVGLESALVDNHVFQVQSLDQMDSRSFEIAVAGPAALLVSKLHKIADRNEDTRHRLKNKDASDVYLLLQRTQTGELAMTLQSLSQDPRVASTIEPALHYLEDFFVPNDGAGLRLLRGAVSGLGDEDVTVASCQALAEDLLAALRSQV